MVWVIFYLIKQGVMMHPENFEILRYWINERELVRIRKEAGEPKPWSEDTVFQRTYFCNVHREDDRVTKWIRQFYSPHVGHHLFTHNIVLARLLNWPETLEYIGYQREWNPERINELLHWKAEDGKIWGSAYVVTTHGLKMDKIDYLTERVMLSAADNIEAIGALDTCETVAEMLQKVEGISTFMAGQIVADLKNTPDHYLEKATDWWSFALPGPGSRRGMDWLMARKVPDRQWYAELDNLRYVLNDVHKIKLCAQDLQNCLCEYDKYMRVSNGTGRSKRNYPGL